MKCANVHTFEKLGFDNILTHLRKKVYSEDAQKQIESLQPSSNEDWIRTELGLVEELKQVFELSDGLPATRFESITRLLDKLQLEGDWLSRDELFRMAGWLKTLYELRKWFHKKKEAYPKLDQLVNRYEFHHELISAIDKILDERGNIRDKASPELGRIRRKQQQTSANLRTTLSRILRKAKENNWSLDSEITIRNDRLVIPVKSDSKGRVPGFVQDVSQSGGTVYVEPAEALPLNNELRELQIGEHNEIIKILKEITSIIREEVPGLVKFRKVMIHVEVLLAKARLAVELKANLPQINPEGNKMEILEGYYPLLLLKAKEEELDVIPLEVALTRNNRIIVISGPNAGGKSVALKTMGLLQLMLQSGLLIPVKEDSTFRIFKSLYVDLGDEQSVASDLSTYTSHLYQWRQMGDQMNHTSLFLIDEFGSGTDPRQGGAIAEAFLERFVRQGAYGVITTHYGNLKDFAEITPGLKNAAMQFDTKGLKPTFRLIPGMPGRSYAFEIAKRVGVHHSILRKAKDKVGTEEIDSEELLKQLERKHARLNNLVRENERKSNQLEQLVEKNKILQLELNKNKKKILREAKVEAKELIENANKRIERTIREIKERKAEKKTTQTLRKKLAATAPVIEPREEEGETHIKTTKEEKNPFPVVLMGESIQNGDWVKLKHSESYGQLIEVQGKKGLVELGEMRMSIRLEQLVKIQPPKHKKKKRELIPSLVNLSAAHTKMELNVMGLRVEDALIEVDKLVDDARVVGLLSLRILHGKGTGVLRDAIRKHLHDYSFITSTADAPIEQGGSGWTLVELSR